MSEAANSAAVAVARLAESRRALDDLRRILSDEEAKRTLAASQRDDLLKEIEGIVGYPIPSLEHLDATINDLALEATELADRIDAGIQNVRSSMPEGA